MYIKKVVFLHTEIKLLLFNVNPLRSMESFMISNLLLDCVSQNYLLPDETLVTYHFDRKLNRSRDIYSFLLVLEIENNSTGMHIEREILLGTNYRK